MIKLPILHKNYNHPDLGLCVVTQFAKHSETDELMVVYQTINGENCVTTISKWLKKLPKLKKENSKDVVEYPEPGTKYRHYKGGKYIVHYMAKDTETGEPVVIYKSLYFGSNHVRPLSMWFENVGRVGRSMNVSRFTTI